MRMQVYKAEVRDFHCNHPRTEVLRKAVTVDKTDGHEEEENILTKNSLHMGAKLKCHIQMGVYLDISRSPA